MASCGHAAATSRQLGAVAGGLTKNWLFVGSEDGANSNAAFTSLLASCRMHGVEPWGYLRDVFCLLPGWSAHRLLELSPLRWRETAASVETQQLLNANVYRGITLLNGL